MIDWNWSNNSALTVFSLRLYAQIAAVPALKDFFSKLYKIPLTSHVSELMYLQIFSNYKLPFGPTYIDLLSV